MSGNGKPPALTPEQIAAQIMQQRAMAAAHEAMQRQAMATACLSGILSGLYTGNPDRPLIEAFGDRAIEDAVGFADRLRKRLAQPDAPPGANDSVDAGTDSPPPPAQ